MPSARGGARIVEVRPSDMMTTPSNIAPSTPTPSNLSAPSSPNPKKARFATTPVDGVTRPLTPTEAWSLYNFETHARQCANCNNPSDMSRLCSEGRVLAMDVAEHVYYRHGEVYSRDRDGREPVRVEVKPGYSQLKKLLVAMERLRQSRARTVPVVNYPERRRESPRRDASPERRDTPRRSERREDPSERRDREESRRQPYDSVTVEPATSTPSRRKSSKKPSRYSTVVVDEDVEASRMATEESRRGSLYDADMRRQRREKGYVVEVREPRREPKREERKKREEGKRRERTEYYYE